MEHRDSQCLEHRRLTAIESKLTKSNEISMFLHICGCKYRDPSCTHLARTSRLYYLSEMTGPGF